nr:hypothetical protein [uncultured Draconibacterium sp.]
MTISKSISELKVLVKDSDGLLNKDSVNLDEVTDFKKRCATNFIEIINLDFNDTTTELAQQGLKYEVKRIKNPFFRWFYNLFTEARDNITFDAPFLKKRTDSDYHKTYIFWTNQRLIGITKYLNELNKE